MTNYNITHTISLCDTKYFSKHQVNGEVYAPGVFVYQAISEAVYSNFDKKQILLSDIQWLVPIIASKELVLNVVISENKFEISDVTNSDICYVTGSITISDSIKPSFPSKIFKEDIKNTTEISSENFYEIFDNTGIMYEACYKPVASAYKKSNDLYLNVTVKKDEIYSTFPSILDAGIQGAIYFANSLKNSTYVPVFAKKMELYSDLSNTDSVCVRKIKASKKKSHHFNIEFLNAEKMVIAILHGVEVKSISHALPGINVNISGNFITNPLVKYLSNWNKVFPERVAINESGYNQIFPDLLNPHSRFYKNSSINFAFLNLEKLILDPPNTLSCYVSEDECQKILTEGDTFKLPNGSTISSLNRFETKYLYDEIFRHQTYEKNGVQINDGCCVFDIGANIGMFSMYISARFPNSRIFAFEPSPATHAVLDRNLKIYCKNATALNYGVGDTSDKKPFVFYKKSSVFSGFSSNVEEDQKALREIITNQLKSKLSSSSDDIEAIADDLLKNRSDKEEHTCQIHNISYVIDQYNIDKINLLKIDAEKFERPILDGIRDEHWERIDQIIIEVHGEAGSDEISSLLGSKGFFVSSEQEALLTNSGLFNIYASRNDGSQVNKNESKEKVVYNDLSEALVAYSQQTVNPLYLSLPPHSQGLEENILASAKVEWFSNSLNEFVKSLDNVNILDNPPQHLFKNNLGIHDVVRDKLGQIPYTENFYAALSNECAKVVTLHTTSNKKVIILDCDNTLWKGVCGEVKDINELIITNKHVMLQKFALDQKSRGAMICVASKNDFSSVINVFENHPGMLLSKDDVVSFKVNWGPKSANILELSANLNLATDSMVFFDDNPAECAEVIANVPNIVCVNLPANEEWHHQIDSLWTFSRDKVTDDDQKRTLLYQQESNRKQHSKSVKSYADFIADLDLDITISFADENDADRISQLYARTNQFTFIKRKLSASEAKTLISSSENELFIVSAKDKFGDYGVIGYFHLESAQSNGHIKAFMLSCRALSKGIEHKMISYIGDHFSARGITDIKIHYQANDRNTPALNFLSESLGLDDVSSRDETRIDTDTAALNSIKFNPQLLNGVLSNSEAITTSNGTQFDQGLYDAILHHSDIKSQIAAVSGGNSDNNSNERNYENIADYIASIFSNVLNYSDDIIPHDVEYEDLGITSIDIISIVKELNKEFEDIPNTVIFEYLSIGDLAAYLESEYPEICQNIMNLESELVIQSEEVTSKYDITEETDGKVAIIGLSGIYPDSHNLNEFWDILASGKNCFRDLRETRWKNYNFAPNEQIYTYQGATVPEFDKFDPLFFKISPSEADNLDPQQRLFLMTCWNLVEDAAYTPRTIGKNVGVFCGVMTSSYGLIGNTDINNGKNVDYDHYEIPNRISYFFDFTGPSLAIDSACSSSLTAIHLACKSLNNNECEYAIAGGINLIIHPSRYSQYCSKTMLSNKGVCTPFDSEADGFVDGEGVGAVLLKPLKNAIADNDRIYGVIQSSAIGSTGKTSGFTVPSPVSQAKLIDKCLADSAISAEDISYVETHGTGTSLGDPIEIRGLIRAFGEHTDKTHYCGIGSVKSNIGHLEAAAGVAGLTKILLQFENQEIAPSAGINSLNKDIKLDGSPFFVVDKPMQWERSDKPRIAAVSSFGAGGANAHLIVSDYPKPVKSVVDTGTYVIPFSAKTEQSLKRYLTGFADFIDSADVSAIDIEATLCKRDNFSHRAIVITNSIEGLKDGICSLLNNNITKPASVICCHIGIAKRNDASSNSAKYGLEHNSDLFSISWCQGEFSTIVPCNEGGSVITLPNYAFDLERYWVKDEQATNAKSKIEDGLFALNNVSSHKYGEYNITLSKELRAFSDHVINNSVVIPAAYIVSAAKIAIESYLGTAPISLRSVRFIAPIVIENEAVDVSTKINIDSRSVSFEIINSGNICCNGFVNLSPAMNMIRLNNAEYSSHKSNIDINDLYSNLADNGIAYGHTYRRIESGSINQDSGDFVVRGTSNTVTDKIALLDSALHSCLTLLDMNMAWVPSQIGEVFVEKDADRIHKVSVQASDLSTDPVFDISLHDDGGIQIGSIVGVKFSPLGNNNQLHKEAKNVGSASYRLLTQQKSTGAVVSNKLGGLNRTCWLLLDSGLVSETAVSELSTSGIKFINASLPLNSSEGISFIEAQQSVIASCDTIIISAPSININETSSYVFSYLGLMKEIFTTRKSINTNIILAHRNTDYISDVTSYSLHALNRTLAKEIEKYNFSYVEYNNEQDLLNNPSLLNTYIDIKVENGNVARFEDKEVSHTDIEPSHKPIKNDGVYVITGGSGNIARLIAADILANTDAKIILLSRSPLSISEFSDLSHFNLNSSRVNYQKLDICDATSLDKFVGRCKNQRINIKGIFHCAGNISDAYFFNMKYENIDAVLSPKTKGTINIDKFAQNFEVDFVVLFSSIASRYGNQGQANYSFANGFLDSFAAQKGQESGNTTKYISINWPFWSDGGMALSNDQLEMYRQNFAMDTLSNKDGIEALWKVIDLGLSNVTVAPILSTFGIPPEKAKLTAVNSADMTADKLKKMVSDILRVPVDRIDNNEIVADYGFNSISFTDFSREVNDEFGLNVTPSLFFDKQTISELSEYITDKATSLPVMTAQHEQSDSTNTISQVASSKAITTSIKDTDVAVIGMECVFPGADNLEDFAALLASKGCSIKQIPSNRYELLGGDINASKLQAGWINGYEYFDENFFKISPTEARSTDPQQRLMLQTVWRALEHSGLSAESLKGSKVGVYIGSATNDFDQVQNRFNSDYDPYLATGINTSIIANRVSFFFDFKGPSEVVNTACSSSIVALKNAIQDLNNGRCDTAIVGGVNLLLSNTNFELFGKAGMLSRDYRCKTFDHTANGYVRGEGVGVVVLKRATDAVSDMNNIWAVVKGIAVNHNGKSNSLTAPNVKSQILLLDDACKKAEIDPNRIGYIEAHGTGTELGDSIELDALTQFYKSKPNSKYKNTIVSIGSVKSNIGHLESAAGIAGLIKMCLSIRNKTKYPTTNFNVLNKFSNLNSTPLDVINSLDEWVPVESSLGSLPRIGAVSSFGYGGVNTHVILEDYIPQHELSSVVRNTQTNSPALFIASAKTADSLKRMLISAKEMVVSWKAAGISIADLERKLITSRDQFEVRYATSFSTFDDLFNKLSDSSIKNQLHKVENQSESTIQYIPGKSEIEATTQKWLSGGNLVYANTGAVQALVNVDLPRYEFNKNSYPLVLKSNKLKQKSALHDLIDENCSTIYSQMFSKKFSVNDWVLQDHKINNTKTLPGVAYFEMAFSSIAMSTKHKIPHLSNCVWHSPIQVNSDDVEVIISIERIDENSFMLEIRSDNDSTKYFSCEFEVNESYGYIPSYTSMPGHTRNAKVINAYELYTSLTEHGYGYAESFRNIDHITLSNKTDAVASVTDIQHKSGYMLSPNITDAMFQILMPFIDNGESSNKETYLPYQVSDVVLLPEFTSTENLTHIHAKLTQNNRDIKIFDVIAYCDQDVPCIIFKNVTIKRIDNKNQSDSVHQLLEKLSRNEISLDEAKALIGT